MVTGKNFVLLNPTLGIEIKKVQDIKEGIEVVVAFNGDPHGYSFGAQQEDVGTIIAVDDLATAADPNRRNVVIIEYKKSRHRAGEFIEDVVAYEDYLDYLKEKGKPTQPVPLYQADQVLYVKPSPRNRACHEYPAIGSQYETDVKVLSSDASTFGNHIYYQVYIPKAGYSQIKEDDLIPANGRLKYLYKDFKEAVMSINAEPFFKKEEVVKIFDGYVYNQDETVVVKLNNELEKLLI
jgi:hypothetical protein